MNYLKVLTIMSFIATGFSTFGDQRGCEERLLKVAQVDNGLVVTSDKDQAYDQTDNNSFFSSGENATDGRVVTSEVNESVEAAEKQRQKKTTSPKSPLAQQQ